MYIHNGEGKISRACSPRAKAFFKAAEDDGLRSVGSVLLRVGATNFLPRGGERCNQVPSHGCLCISDERHFPGSRSALVKS